MLLGNQQWDPEKTPHTALSVVSKHAPTELTELPAVLLAPELEGKFSPGFQGLQALHF